MQRTESGNAVVFILIAIALFAALAYTFTRDAKTGQGNLTAGQAKLKAQELATFFKKVEVGINKLRQRGCSVNDISFAYPGSTSGLYWMDPYNDPATAPPDKSCHIFEAAGAGVAMNIKLSDYQAPLSHIVSGEQGQYNHMLFSGAGTKRSMGMNFVNTKICEAYNHVVENGMDYSIIGFGSWTTAKTYCHQEGNTLQNGGPNNQIQYLWLED